MKFFVMFLILIGFIGLSHAENFRPDSEDFRKGTGFEIDLSPLYVIKEIYPPPLPPLKQSMSGIDNEEIQCKSKLHLIIKHDSNPACVTSPTAAKLTDKSQRVGWTPSEQLWRTLEEQIYSISDPSSCPHRCTTIEPVDTLQEAKTFTNIQVEMPPQLPKNYDYFQFFTQENSLSVQILPKPFTQNTHWGKFYLIDKGIFLTLTDYPITLDAKAQVEYWAKTHNAKKISFENYPSIYAKERTIIYDEDFDLLFLGPPSEAQFNIDDEISAIIVGYVPQEDLISIAKLFLE